MPIAARLLLLIFTIALSSGCATSRGISEDSEPTVMDPVPEVSDEATNPETAAAADTESKEKEGEVPLAVAESEQAEAPIPEVVVQARIRGRHEAIHDLVTEGADTSP